MSKITLQTVDQIAKLANIPINEEEKEKLAQGFNETLKVVDELFKVDVTGIEPTHQTTNLENVFHEDEVDEEKMLTQDEALSQAKNKKDGYFLIDQILEDD